MNPSITDVLAGCIQACTDAALACTSCADACLAEDAVAQLRTTIRLAQDTAEMCTTTARMELESDPGQQPTNAAVEVTGTPAVGRRYITGVTMHVITGWATPL
ncbi:hypothetical protein [Nesterenkonia sp. DZ6]|uniref:hypothetical protein n=1 Tax=Nesterenkonia sp. DZ6 TaxID=2901229 RepID=UPI001F4CE0EA|nr:hypothetical protein [Nesterenkonia sp. DZ6]MCH8561387.1 hypothetical protein [Nesterenkonia sp. DZ6]